MKEPITPIVLQMGPYTGKNIRINGTSNHNFRNPVKAWHFRPIARFVSIVSPERKKMTQIKHIRGFCM